MVKVKVYSIATSGTDCVLLLEESDGPRLLPIWIGITEGQAIALKFAEVTLPRPMTHDLLVNTISSLGCKINHVLVNDLKGQTFYAQVHVSHNSTRHVIDARPSDAIALAGRANCPIFVEDKVYEKCHAMKKPISEDEVKKFKEELKHIKPEDIVKGLKEKGGKKPKETEPEDAPSNNEEDEEEKEGEEDS